MTDVIQAVLEIHICLTNLFAILRREQEMPEVMESPYKQARDGPSRQLLWELGKLQIDYQEEFQAKLDKDAGDRESAHRAALAAAVVEHERIRRSAEIEREKLEIQIQLERTRREAEERRELEQQQQDKVEKELAEKRKNIERTKAAEIAQMKAIQEHRAEQAAAEAAEQQRLKEEKEEAAIAAKKLEQKQETERLARERERERERQRAQEQEQEQEQKLKREADVVQVVPPLAQVTPISAEIPSQDTQQPKNGTKREAEHSRYILIHQKLKELRRYMADQGRQDLNLKKRMGEMRRTIKKCVGQLTGEKTANKAPVSCPIIWVDFFNVIFRETKSSRPSKQLLLSVTPMLILRPFWPYLLIRCLKVRARLSLCINSTYSQRQSSHSLSMKLE